MKVLSTRSYNALKTAESDAMQAREELKGYYDMENAMNEYFTQISANIRGLELPPVAVVSRDEIKRLYEQCGPVQGVVNYIADNIGEVMRYLELTDGKGDLVERHPVLDLLRRPNDRFSLRKFGRAWAVNRLLFGDAWVYAPKQKGKVIIPKEMYVIPSHRIAVKQGEVQPMEGVRIVGTSMSRTIGVDELFESFDYNLDDTSFFGTSKIVAAALYLNVIQKGMQRQDVALKNGGVSNIITPAKDNNGVMPKDANTVEDRFNDKRNFGKTIALRIPVDVHELGNKPVDLSILDSHKEAITALCFVYKIPVDLYYGQSKYENAKEAKKAIFEQAAIPMANEFAEDLLHYLKLDIQGYELKVNTDLIDVLKEDSGEVLDNLSKMHASLNEMREAYGYERIEEDYADQPMIPMGVQFGNESYDIEEPSGKVNSGEEDDDR